MVGPEAEGLFTLFGIAFFLIGITLFGIVLSGLWNLIDMVMIVSGKFTDADGRLIRNWT